MIIRKETDKDFEAVYHTVKTAFKSAEKSDGNEQDLVNALRKGNSFIPALSLVAEINGMIVGHIMFTKAEIAGSIQLALAPLSVLPEYQKQGIGTALIKEGHRIAKELGFDYSIVLGSETYYKKTGYLPANRFGIKPPFDVPSENFMAYKLNENAPNLCGVLKYAKEFEIGS